MLTTILETQPKDSGGGSGKSTDDIVKEICEDYLSKMPPDFVEEIFRAQITKLKGPPGVADKGFGAPLNIFLFQELQRLQNIILIVRTNLQALIMAIDGTVVMTPELLQDLNSVFDAKVPGRWTHDPSGAEISWLMPNIGSWFTGLLDRQILLHTFLEHGRGHMKAYWMTGFTNAQGFLTAVRQEVTRQHKKDQWALDDVVNHTDILLYDVERVKDVPEEGQNIHGLFMEGARWNRQDGRIDESEPKKLFVPMPVIWDGNGLAYTGWDRFRTGVFRPVSYCVLSHVGFAESKCHTCRMSDLHSHVGLVQCHCRLCTNPCYSVFIAKTEIHDNSSESLVQS